MYVFFAFPPPPKKNGGVPISWPPNKPDCWSLPWNRTSVAQVWVAPLPELPAKAGPGACPATWRWGHPSVLPRHPRWVPTGCDPMTGERVGWTRSPQIGGRPKPNPKKSWGIFRGVVKQSSPRTHLWLGEVLGEDVCVFFCRFSNAFLFGSPGIFVWGFYPPSTSKRLQA